MLRMKLGEIIRLVCYVLVFLYVVVQYRFLQSHFLFMAIIIMLAAPVLSIVSCIVMLRRVEVTIENREGPETMARQGEEYFLKLVINNRAIAQTLDAQLNISVENAFLGTAGGLVLDVPVYLHGKSSLDIPIVPTAPGLNIIRIERLVAKDLCSFFRFKRKLSAAVEVVVLPEHIYADAQMPDISENELNEGDESAKRGSDYSDVTDIREYVPGDKLKNIHWKLSAKKELLMVKERTGLSDKEAVVVTELYNGELLSGVLSYTYSVLYYILNRGLSAKLIYWSVAEDAYVEEKIDTFERLDAAFETMFYGKPYAAEDEALRHMSSVYTQIKTFYYIYAEKENVRLVIREN